jgi:hypothetical protein
VAFVWSCDFLCVVLSAHEQREKKKKRWPGFQPGISGNPAGRREPKGLAELVETLKADFADVELTAIDKILLENAARLLLRASRSADGEVVVRLSSEARRTLLSLRSRSIKRAAKGQTVALTDYLARVHPEADEMAERSASRTDDEGAE